MSLLDKEEVLLYKIDKMAEDKVLWDKFHKEVIEPILEQLKNIKRMLWYGNIRK